jgi:gamma-glutamyl:cysteine ligase YbdK (ATP-grasp superfamily)
MSGPSSLHLFEAFGVELEYMLVGAGSLSVLPAADQLLAAAAGEVTADVERGDISWSNELALHVIELKTSGPARSLAGLAASFQENVGQLNGLLGPLSGRLMPTAMHPWMDPAREMRLWPHDASPVYEAFNRIFDCRGHGWANLQSVHLNLPFAGDEEFGRLHAAIRVLLPILPALAASSPVVEGRLTGLCDSRMEVYRTNSARIPSITGLVVPEPVYTRRDYEEGILRRLYHDIAPFDPEGILRHEWLNARGAIARFERNTIEVRVLDVQECPLADLTVCAVVAAALELLISGRLAPEEEQRAFPTERLSAVLLSTIRDADEAVIGDPEYLHLFGLPPSYKARTAGNVWQELWPRSERSPLFPAECRAPLRVLLERGPLARRILRALGKDPSRQRMEAVYRELCDCLAAGRMFMGSGEW